MKKIICFGEALIDFLNTNKDTNDGVALNSFGQFPGGAPANAAVAVAKLGGDAYFLGQVGDDAFGHFLHHSLERYGVKTDALFKHATAKTALAFVMRDDKGERSFSFYRDNSADVLFESAQIPTSLFEQEGLFHFCSNTLTDSIITETTQAALNIAQSNNYKISFDVNLRHNLWREGAVDINLTNRFVNQANILKFSKDEIDYLSEGNEKAYIENCLANQCEFLIITNDGAPIRFYSHFNFGTVAAPKVDVIDTTAGGDGFIGGLLYLLGRVSNMQTLLKNEQEVHQVISFAAACGAIAVTRLGAFPALPVFNDVKSAYPDFL